MSGQICIYVSIKSCMLPSSRAMRNSSSPKEDMWVEDWHFAFISILKVHAYSTHKVQVCDAGCPRSVYTRVSVLADNLFTDLILA